MSGLCRRICTLHTHVHMHRYSIMYVVEGEGNAKAKEMLHNEWHVPLCAGRIPTSVASAARSWVAIRVLSSSSRGETGREV